MCLYGSSNVSLAGNWQVCMAVLRSSGLQNKPDFFEKRGEEEGVHETMQEAQRYLAPLRENCYTE